MHHAWVTTTCTLKFSSKASVDEEQIDEQHKKKMAQSYQIGFTCCFVGFLKDSDSQDFSIIDCNRSLQIRIIGVLLTLMLAIKSETQRPSPPASTSSMMRAAYVGPLPLYYAHSIPGKA